MKRILVAIDGSPAADKALEVALDLATQHEAEIRLLHVLLRDKEPAELLRLPDLGHARKDLAGELARLARQPFTPRSAAEIMRNPSAPDRPVPLLVLRKIGVYLLKRAGVLAGTRCVRVEALKLAIGPVAQTITATAIAERADTIVMGSRGNISALQALAWGVEIVCREPSRHRTRSYGYRAHRLRMTTAEG